MLQHQQIRPKLQIGFGANRKVRVRVSKPAEQGHTSTHVWGTAALAPHNTASRRTSLAHACSWRLYRGKLQQKFSDDFLVAHTALTEIYSRMQPASYTCRL